MLMTCLVGREYSNYRCYLLLALSLPDIWTRICDPRYRILWFTGHPPSKNPDRINSGSLHKFPHSFRSESKLRSVGSPGIFIKHLWRCRGPKTKQIKVEYHIHRCTRAGCQWQPCTERVVCEFFRFVSITIAASRSRLRNWNRLVSLGTTAFLQKISPPKVHAEFSAASTTRTEKLCIAEGDDFYPFYHLLTMAKTFFFSTTSRRRLSLL